MNVLDIFMLGVEASIVLVGFAGIIATFQFGDDSEVRRAPIAALTMIVQCSLVGAFMSALPLLVHAFGVSDAALWTICSGVGLPITITMMYLFHRYMGSAIQQKSQFAIFVALQFITLLVVIFNVLNIADVVFHREPGPVLLGIVHALSIAAYMFSRLLLRPLWRRVRELERAIPAT